VGAGVAVVGMGSVAMTIGLLFASAAATARKERKIRDDLLASLGLTQRRSLFGGPTYHGVLEGRPVEARYTEARRYAPAVLAIEVRASARLHLALELRHLHRTNLSVVDGKHELPLEGPQSERLVACAPEVVQSARALRDPAVMTAILRLFSDEVPGLPSITIAPDGVTFGIAGPLFDQLDARHLRAHVHGLAALAHALEALPPS
jgi:hypothetical protein